MRRFQVYCRWNEKLYTYDGIFNTILCLENGIWTIITVLPMEVDRQPFTTISIYKNKLYLYGRAAEYIVWSRLGEKKVELIELSADWADEEGDIFSNLLMKDDEIILLPFRKSQSKVFDSCGNIILKDWQNDFEKVMEKLRLDYGVAQIRAWGAHIIDGKIFVIFTDSKQDKIAVYDMNNKKIELYMIDMYEKLFHLSYYANRFYVQGIYKSAFQIVELNLEGRIIRKVQLKSIVNGLHMQWLDSGKCIVLDEEKLFVIDTDFSVREIPLLSDEGLRLKYVNNDIFITSSNKVYYFNVKRNQFFYFKENEDADKMLFASDEYRQRMIDKMIEQSKECAIGEIDGEITLERFLEGISINMKKIKCQSERGDSIWYNISRE